MATMTKNVIAAGSGTRPSMLEKGMCDSWKTQIILYICGKENGEMLKDLINNDPYQFKPEITVKDTDGVTEIHRPQRLEDLAGEDKLRYDNDIKVVNILLLGLLVDIYTLINHYESAKEIWDRVKELMEGTKMTKQERQSMLYDEFEKFTYDPRESIHSYYLRFTKLINDMKMIPMTMSPMKINTKFVNHLQPDWSSYAPTVVQQPPIYQPDIGLAIPTFLPSDDPIKSLNKAMIFLSNVGNNQASGARVINTVGNEGVNQPRVVRCYNCNGEGHIAKQCTKKKRVKDSEATTNFKADHIDAYDSDYDDEATSNAIFMANLSPVGSLNDDTVKPRYDSDIHYEVPHYDTYHDSNMFSSNIQELGYIENIVSNNESYDELKGNNDVISYTDYMLTIGNDEDNYVPPPIQKNDLILSVIEQMKSQVEKCNIVNQESKSMNESLTNELEQYKDSVRLLEYAIKDGHSEQEAYLSRELYSAINDRNRKVANFEKQVFSQQTQMNDLNNHIAFLKRNFETLKQESSEKYEKNINEIVDLEKPKRNLKTFPLITISKPKVYPKKLPSTSQVLRNMNKAREILTKFGECIKRRTTLSPHEIGSWEQSDIKGAFKKDVIPFSKNVKETFKLFEKGFITEVKEMNDIFEQMEDEIDQYSVEKKSFEIKKKQLLINNGRLLEENIASDIMCTYLRSLNEVDNFEKCKTLEIVLLDLQESNKSLCELRKHFVKLEEYNFTLDIAFQNHKE
ncbi:retrovirus-related pol polyprotein from transposon TNT 1-94 [Tanacetum coccineum]